MTKQDAHPNDLAIDARLRLFPLPHITMTLCLVVLFTVRRVHRRPSLCSRPIRDGQGVHPPVL